MYKGDISNNVPQRIIVVDELFLMLDYEELPKKFGIVRRKRKKVSFKKEVLSRLYLWAVNQPTTIELASFTLNAEELQKVFETLDKYGTNPFRYCVTYESVAKLVSELPYRPELIGVIDRPDRLLRYGHWGMDIANL
jgi:hypothetical protein